MHIDELWSELGADLVAAFRRWRNRLASLEVSQKADRTLLTDADLAVEALIVDKIRQFDAKASIIAEESGSTIWRPDVERVPDRVWVVDPIDGTAEFVLPGHVEFCGAVCLLEHGRPVHALVVAPELGTGRTPLVLVAASHEGRVTINGSPARPSCAAPPARAASVTRSASSPARAFEAVMAAAGYELKTRTTSQTLDMVRTALDLSPVAEGSPRFDLFFRQEQKVWDGLAGLCFGESVGLAHADLSGCGRVPVSSRVLAQHDPTFDSTVMGLREAVGWFVEIARA